MSSCTVQWWMISVSFFFTIKNHNAGSSLGRWIAFNGMTAHSELPSFYYTCSIPAALSLARLSLSHSLSLCLSFSASLIFSLSLSHSPHLSSFSLCLDHSFLFNTRGKQKQTFLSVINVFWFTSRQVAF